MNYILYDLEATCWLGRPPKGIQEIIEIGAVKVNEYGEVLGEYNKFVQPTVNKKLSCKIFFASPIVQYRVNHRDNNQTE